MRHPHYLTSNKQNEIPMRCIFVDTETRSIPINETETEQVLTFGWAAYVRRYDSDKWGKPKWIRFETPDQLWDFVESKSAKNSKLYVFAHNLAFDLPVLKGMQILSDRGYTLKSPIIDGPPTILPFRKESKTILLLDSLNFFRMPLSSMGEFVGLEKLEMPTEGGTDALWDDYCKRDVTILMEAMIQYLNLVRTWDLGNFQKTLPAQAFTCFRHQFMNKPIFIDANEMALSIARDSYKGGRVEAFRLGKIHEDVYYYDVNSMYPYLMSVTKTPVKLRFVASQKITMDELNICEDESAIAQVLISTADPVFGIRLNGRLTFPVGEYRTTLAWPELMHARDNNLITKVEKLVVYESAIIFKEYVDFFYQERLKARREGNKPLEVISKLFGSSLYGKFGQMGKVFKDIDTVDNQEVLVWKEWDVQEKRVVVMRQLGGVIQELSTEGESRNSHPAISSTISSAGRMMLWGLMVIAGRDNVLYCDTDSLMVTKQGSVNLSQYIDDVKMGWLKNEWSSNSVVIHGPKDYQFGAKAKTKGISSNSLYLGNNTWQQPQFIGFNGMVRAGNLNRQVIKTVTKTLKREYKKGTVKNGKVSPYRLELMD